MQKRLDVAQIDLPVSIDVRGAGAESGELSVEAIGDPVVALVLPYRGLHVVDIDFAVLIVIQPLSAKCSELLSDTAACAR